MSILQMLTYMRPAGSEAEKEFLERYIQPHKPATMAKNLIVTVPGGSGETIFSCHTDTVHWKSGRQEVIYDKDMNIAYKDKASTEALGADDTAGVWVLLHMIEAKKPGTYMFHYGEEKGCIGSREMAKTFPDWLKKFKRAIAFDRRGTTSIITRQTGNDCCSPAFAEELAKRLGNGFEPDPTGLYTDTASYMHLIPECSNISVGYAHEHSSNETLDIEHMQLIANLAVEVNWDSLPTVRKLCTESVRDRVVPVYYGNQYNSGAHRGHRHYDYEKYKKPEPYKAPPKQLPRSPAPDVDYDGDDDWLIEAGMEEGSTYERILELIRKDSEYAATIMYAYICRELKAEAEKITKAHEKAPASTDEVATAVVDITPQQVH